MVLKLIFILLILFQSTVWSCDNDKPYPDKVFVEVNIETNLGNIVVELDRNRSPITVNNFLKYVEKNLYNNTIIHRIEKDFVIQGGGYDQKLNSITECGKIFNESGNGLKNTKGTIAMARYDNPHSATSQFYFNMGENEGLDPNRKNWGYTVFGVVIEGIDVLETIAEIETGIHNDLDSTTFPKQEVLIKKVTVQ